ncbi:MAG: GIY-YIG nuclease family protein [Gallionellaceae bacterium]|nr:GIY-YIG nuclease family protein [Gallionellaceae bacterium]MDD5364715.1 GIY-YIG nuclease family protein [Gallionellaceae bacterium]
MAMAAPDPCTYQLVIHVARSLEIQVGRLGNLAFPPGTYVYTGSARRNFEARIARHLRQEKTLRWHIDYLLAASGVSVLEVRRSASDECTLNQATAGKIVAPRFGASDCRHGCRSHLKRISDR